MERDTYIILSKYTPDGRKHAVPDHARTLGDHRLLAEEYVEGGVTPTMSHGRLIRR